MPKFDRISLVQSVEAIQFTGSNQEEIVEWMQSRGFDEFKYSFVIAKHINENRTHSIFAVEKEKEDNIYIRIHVNDYVINHNSGEKFYSYPSSFFLSTFQQAD